MENMGIERRMENSGKRNGDRKVGFKEKQWEEEEMEGRIEICDRP